MNSNPPINPRESYAQILQHVKVLCDKKGGLKAKLEELAAEGGWSIDPAGEQRVPERSTLYSWMKEAHWTIGGELTDDQYKLLPFLEDICHKDRRLTPALEYFANAKNDAPIWFKGIDFKAVSKPGASQYGDLSQNESLQIGDRQLAELLLKNKVGQLEHAQEQKDSGAEMECLCSLASLAAELEDWPKTIDYRKAIVRLHEKNNDCLQHAAGLTSLARDQFSAGSYVEAIQNLKSARILLLDLQNPNQELLCETLDYMGVCTRALSRDEKKDNKTYALSQARDRLNESLRIREKLKSPPGIASTLHRLGHLLAQVAYLEEMNGNESEFHDAFLVAEQSLRDAMDLRMKLGLRLDYCRSANQYVSLFLTFLDKSPPKQLPEEDIRRLLEETSRLAKESELRKIWFQSLITLLRFERKLQNYIKAIEVFDAAFESKDVAFTPSDFEKAKLIEQRAKIAGDMLDSSESYWWQRAEDLWRALGDEKRRFSAGQNWSKAEVNKLSSRRTSSTNTKRTVAK